MSEAARDPEATAPRAAGGRERRAGAALACLLPGLLLLLLYAPALDYPYTWTDTTAIAGGTLLRPPGELGLAFREPLHRIPHRGTAAQQSYYRPLQVIGLSLVAARDGAAPRHYRAAGLAVGALALALFAHFAGGLLGSPWAGGFAAALVAAHPVGIETYVWIAGTSGALCALFTVAALASGRASCDAGSPRAAALLGGASLLALAAGLLSKERALVEPLLLAALFAGAYRSPGFDRRRATLLVAAHVAVAAAVFLGPRRAALGATHTALPWIGDDPLLHVATAVAHWPAALGWMLLPLHSSTSDVVRWADGLGDPRCLLGLALALGSLLAWWLCLRRGRTAAALGIAWVWIAFAPTSGLLPQLHASGERYLFLSTFGAALVVADAGRALARRSGAIAGALLALALLGLLAQRTAARLPDWESNLRLFQGDVARDPAFREGTFLVASELAREGRVDAAAATLDTLRAGGPAFQRTSSYLNPLSVNELACSLALARGRPDAVLALEAELAHSAPGLARAPSLRTCFGRAHNARGDTARALELYLGAARDLKNDAPPVLYVMIARNHLRLGQAREAAGWLARARASGDPAVLAQVRRLEAKLSAGAPPPETPRPR